jgi:hypothetical protein
MRNRTGVSLFVLRAYKKGQRTSAAEKPESTGLTRKPSRRGPKERPKDNFGIYHPGPSPRGACWKSRGIGFQPVGFCAF